MKKLHQISSRLPIPAFLTLLFCCNNPGADTLPEEPAATAAGPEAVVEIRTAPVRSGAFPLRTLSTGTLTAARQAELSLRTGGYLTELPVQPGQYLQKGELVAALDPTDLRFAVKRAEVQLAAAHEQEADLIQQAGGQPEADSTLTSDIRATIRVRAGVPEAELELESAQTRLRQAQLYAPFSGWVADLAVSAYQQIDPGQVICRLIDPDAFAVDLLLLETTALQMRTGQPVEVRLPAPQNRKLQARIAHIDPVVNEQGLVKVQANLGAIPKGIRVFEGMSVEAAIEEPVPDQLIVPKEAVVLRSGRQVIFTYDAESGLAKWNYVEVAYENDEMAAIAEGLQAGQQVIIEGNLNLSHDAQVTVNGKR